MRCYQLVVFRPSVVCDLMFAFSFAKFFLVSNQSFAFEGTERHDLLE
jgi:hypothetical protein